MKMKIFFKLFVWATLLSGCGQVALAQQNYFAPGVPPSSNSFAPTFRYITGSADSLNSLFLGLGGNKWYRVGSTTNYFQSTMLTGSGTFSDPFGIANNYITPAMLYSISGVPGAGTVYYGDGHWGAVSAFGGNADSLNHQPPSYYLNRANHTGTQAESTVTNLVTDLAAKVPTTTTVAGFALSSNVTLGTLTISNGLIGTSYNPSGATTIKADTSVLQTVLNFFPKGDTRYVKTSRQVIAGTDLTGGGALTSDVTLNADTTTGKLATQYYASKVVGPDGIITGLVTTTVTTTATTTAGTYRLNNAIIVKSGSTNTTIDAQDATLNRYDLIVGDASGVFTKVQGTLATTPVEPDIPANKALIASIYIPVTGGTVQVTGGGNGKGSVTKVTGVNANGFTWSIANSTTTPTITLTLQNATTSQSGQLSATDWNTFNNKQAALSGTGFVKISGTTISYDNSTYYKASDTTSTLQTISNYFPKGDTRYVRIASPQLTTSSTTNYIWTATDASGHGSWQAASGGGLASSNFVYTETPSGTINGSNVTFTLANSPVTGKVELYKNGVLLNSTEYSISGSTITYTVAPNTVPYSDVLLASYIK